MCVPDRMLGSVATETNQTQSLCCGCSSGCQTRLGRTLRDTVVHQTSKPQRPGGRRTLTPPGLSTSRPTTWLPTRRPGEGAGTTRRGPEGREARGWTLGRGGWRGTGDGGGVERRLNGSPASASLQASPRNGGTCGNEWAPGNAVCGPLRRSAGRLPGQEAAQAR